jgi:hypothetical protein
MGTVQAQTACSPGQLTAAQTPIRIFLKKREDAFPSIRGEDGAGEEIRTLDPNLGKVVLYP